ncbi:hypothetical protein KCU95_g4508, partial [Aureobasidium melanogenum]
MPSAPSCLNPYTRPLLRLAVVALTLSPTLANPLIPKEIGIGSLTFNSLFGRGNCENPCGWSGQLCCTGGESCYTDSSNQAQCASTTAAAAASETTGYWKYWTSTWVETQTETDLITKYSTGSSWCGEASTTAAAGGGGGVATSVWVAPSTAAASPTASISCNWDKGESSCGSICCASDQYCLTSGQCAAAAGASTTSKLSSGSSTGISPAILPTSSTLVIVTAISSPTTTVPFVAPVATGANITLTGAESSNSHGLSGGAIAGIVIGVIAGLILLSLLCLFCCARTIWLAIFGGRKRRRTERTEVIEPHHHRSYSGAGGAYAASRPDDRRWYGSEAPRREKERSKFTELLGIGAGLAALAGILGLKRRHDRRRDEKSEYSSAYTDASYSDYYTSESSASSDDRRTRHTRRSSRHR